jgi:hypothetical protein
VIAQYAITPNTTTTTTSQHASPYFWLIFYFAPHCPGKEGVSLYRTTMQPRLIGATLQLVTLVALSQGLANLISNLFDVV